MNFELFPYQIKNIIPNGIYLSQSLDKFLQTKRQLVELPTSVNFEKVNKSIHRYYEFESEKMSKKFSLIIEKVGATILGISDGIFSISKCFNNEVLKENAQINNNIQQFYEKKKLIINDKLKYKLDKKKLRFTKEVLEELRVIYILFEENKISSTKVKEVIKNFFNKFGTHINTGYYYFGGIYISSAYLKGFQLINIGEAKNKVSNTLQIKVIKGREFFNILKNDQEVNTVLNIYGGNQNLNSIEKWEDSLDNYNGLVITRVDENYVSVGNILLNYEIDEIIDDIFGFSMFLNKTWVELNGIKMESS